MLCSAYGGLGQSSASRALGGLLASLYGKKALYLEYAEICEEKMGPGCPEGLREAVYGICCEGSAALNYRSSLLEDEFGMLEFPCMGGISPFGSLSEELAEDFIRALAGAGMFDCIILDVQNKSARSGFFAELCEEIVLVKPAFEKAQKHDILESRLRQRLSRSPGRRMHILDLGALSPEERLEIYGSDIYSPLAAVLRPLAADLAGRMENAE